MRALPFLALLPLLAAACSPAVEPTLDGGTEPTDSTPSGNPVAEIAVSERLVNGYTGFGLKLFRAVADDAGDENVFLSPSSVAFALGMTYNGADGATREAMARALGVQGMSLDEVNAASRDWRLALARPDTAVELTIANSLWGRQGTPFRDDFLQRTRTFFAAEVASLDFDDPSASRTINEWVSRSTGGRIRDIVPAQIDPQTILYLINAIHFKGLWSRPFDPRATRDGPWHLPDGSTVPHPMMHRDGAYRLFDGDGFTAVGLPYGSGRVAMYVFLPDEGSSLAELRGRLEAGEWEQWMDGFREGRVMLTLPRFRMEYEVQLVQALRALGMGIAFDPERADFGGMLPRDYLARNNAYISDVKHKTFLEVAEWGTEAAGATSVEVGVTSMPPSVVVDRPFLLAIRDDKTGTVLFLGQIVDPR